MLEYKFSGPDEDDDDEPCGSCGGTGGEYADAWEDGEQVDDVWVPCSEGCDPDED